MNFFSTIAEYKKWKKSLDSSKKIGFVPTMGALHAGHAQLLQRLRTECDELVLSIFVNPTQFGPKEDFQKYPRTLKEDIELAEKCEVNAVFHPSSSEMYPQGLANFSTLVDEKKITLPLCGQFRPGHFSGVATVVLKLLNIIEPHIAAFGLKDAQQFFLLHKMSRDFNLNTQIVGIPTVREADGLAMSSRNRYLSMVDREKAASIYKTLNELREALESMTDIESFQNLLKEKITRLEKNKFQIQYLEARKLPSFDPITAPTTEAAMIAIACMLGSTRLIDNIILKPELLSKHGITILN